MHSSTFGLWLRLPDPYPPMYIPHYFQVILWKLTAVTNVPCVRVKIFE